MQFSKYVDEFDDEPLDELPDAPLADEPDPVELEPDGLCFAGRVSSFVVTLSPSPGPGQSASSVNAGWSSHLPRTRSMADFSAGTTQRSYLCFTAICRATYSQR